MRTAVVISLIGIYILGMLRPIAPYIEYELNKGYISEFLCINKEKTESITVCYGKCYLTKKLKEAQAQDSNEPASTINIQEYPIGFVEVMRLGFLEITPHTEYSSGYFSSYTYQYVKGIDHPPSIS